MSTVSNIVEVLTTTWLKFWIFRRQHGSKFEFFDDNLAQILRKLSRFQLFYLDFVQAQSPVDSCHLTWNIKVYVYSSIRTRKNQIICHELWRTSNVPDLCTRTWVLRWIFHLLTSLRPVGCQALSALFQLEARCALSKWFTQAQLYPSLARHTDQSSQTSPIKSKYFRR